MPLKSWCVNFEMVVLSVHPMGGRGSILLHYTFVHVQTAIAHALAMYDSQMDNSDR